MNRLAALSALGLSFWLLVLPRVFPICSGLHNGEPMPCYYTYQAEFILALLAVVVSGGLFFLKTGEGRAVSGFFLVLLGVSVVVLPRPWAVGLCLYGSCVKTAFFSDISGLLLAAAGVAAVWFSLGRATKQREIKEH
jgi:uncharacterized membrane protein